MGTTMQKSSHRFIAAVAAAAIAFTSLGTVAASAAGAKRHVAAHHVTRHHVYRRGGNAAALGLFTGVLGTIATLAARDQYYDGYYGPRYYAPYPAYGYGYGPYYRGW
jgi:hypothetical protein